MERIMVLILGILILLGCSRLSGAVLFCRKTRTS